MADFSVQFRFNGFPIRLQRFGWEDVNALFGNNNDRIATFWFNSFNDPLPARRGAGSRRRTG
ncbi:MAG: hypothetical protein ACT4PJ_10490 [Gemmatimonadaceae bacterium]